MIPVPSDAEGSTDKGHRHATDCVDGTVVAECPNIEEDPESHLSFTADYGDAADTDIFEELLDAFPTCGECGSELQAIHQQEPAEVLE